MECSRSLPVVLLLALAGALSFGSAASLADTDAGILAPLASLLPLQLAALLWAILRRR
ncbi:MAG: hypothetical protein VKI83_02015 [Synechococcaceae cyanobacterium]|nr:hypothetical protein [Synechococcaceae cyanobacterium]